MKTAYLLIVLATFLATACGSVLESGKPARQVYMLHTPKAPSNPATTAPAPTLIISVHAVPGLDTDLILVLGSDAKLIPVANGHWADNMPEVFTSITRRYLSDTGQFKTVKEATIARPGEWLLSLELQAFYGTQDSAGNTDGVELKIEGLLSCGDDQHVLRIRQKAGADAASLASLVAAHQRVLDAAMRELPTQILAACT